MFDKDLAFRNELGKNRLSGRDGRHRTHPTPASVSAKVNTATSMAERRKVSSDQTFRKSLAHRVQEVLGGPQCH